MKRNIKKLQLEQMSSKLGHFEPIQAAIAPQEGWIKAVRIALGMTLKQLGSKLNMTPQGVRKLETSEANGSISLNKLKKMGAALDLKLIYGFVSKHESLEQMIEVRAQILAEQIVMRTHQSMLLEDQAVTYERLKKSMEEKTKMLNEEMPKYLWD